MQRLKSCSLMQKISICLYVFLIIFVTENSCIAFTFYKAKDKDKVSAKEVEKQILTERKSVKEKEKALIEHFYAEGERLFEEGDYGAAIDYFSRILEIDPKHRGAKRGMEKVKQKMQEKKKIASPLEVAKQLMRSGRLKYSMKDYDGAIENFQDALVLDYSNKEILEWLKRARRRKSLEEIGTEESDLLRDTEIATRKKETQEKQAMLEVETAYLPPEKPKKEPTEIEETVLPEEEEEEEEEEKARQELLKKLKSKMIPAISLTEADIRDVIRQLMEITGVTIVIDEGALAKAVEKGPLLITFSTVNPVPLLEVLDIALRATELGYRVEPNYIWISTPEKLKKEELVTKTYRLMYGVRRIRKVELKKFETKKAKTE